MRRIATPVVILAVAAIVWRSLANVVPAASERFYFVVPPTFLALFAAIVADWRSKLRRHLPTVVLVIAYFATVLWAVVAFLAADWRLTWRTWAEIACSVYFLVAVAIIVGVLRWGVRGLCGRLAHLLPAASWRRTLVGDVLPVTIVAFFVTPYLIAAAYVHRVKLPTRSDPLQRLQRPYEEVAFETTDGLTIRGWFLPSVRPSQRTLLICHGLGGNREAFLSYVPVADRLEANVLIFDFRGHGDSDGHSVTLGLAEKNDVAAAIAYLRCERPNESVALFGLGISMGSGALVLAAAELERPLDGLILDSGMAYSLDLTDRILMAFPAAVRPWLTFSGIPLLSLHAGCPIEELRPEACIAQVRAPVFVVHSLGDKLIPPQHGERLYAGATGTKELFLAPTASHGDVFHVLRQEYLQRVEHFFIRVVQPLGTTAAP